MVIWLEDLHDQDDERAGTEPVRAAQDDRPGGDVDDERAATSEGSEEEPVIDVTDGSEESEDADADPEASKAEAAAARADDEGWSLLDLEAARFTRH